MNQIRPPPQKGHELSGIEVMRFICAISVLIWHYQNLFFVGAFEPDVGFALRPTLPLYSAFSVFYDNGSQAVQFFWVISGFIFYWHYARTIASGATQFADFVVRRFSRLYPLHLITLLLVAGLQWIYLRSHQTGFIYIWDKPIWFVAHLLFASNWFARQPLSFNGPIWSVSIEILVYLLFFVLVRRFGPRAWVAACCAVISALVYRFVSGPINPDVFGCSMYFFAGGVAQRLSASRHAPKLAAAVVAAALLLRALGYGHLNAAYLLSLAVGLVILFARSGESGALASVFRRCAFLGNATYSSYLIHFPLQLLLVIGVDALGWKRSVFLNPMAFLGFLVLVVALSLAVYRYFEVPAQNFLRTSMRQREPVRPAAAVR